MKKQSLLTLLFALLAMTGTHRAQAQELRIEGVPIDLSASGNIAGSWLTQGTLSWDVTSKTLTLNNATLVSETNDFIRVGGELTITLNGSNSITANNYVAFRLLNATCTINGSGSLNVRSSWMPIFFDRNSTLTLDGCEVKTNQYIGNNSGPYLNNHLVVKNATLRTGSIAALTSITLKDCYIQTPTGGQVVTSQNGEGQDIMMPDGSSGYAQTVIVPGAEPAVETTIPQSGYATFYTCAQKGTIAGNVTLYTGTVNGNKLTLTPRADRNLPAGTGVVVKGTAGEKFTFTVDNNVIPEPVPVGNALTGNDYGRYAKESDDLFALSTLDDATAFYRVQTDVLIMPRRAYLNLTGQVGVKALAQIVFEDEATAIRSIEATAAESTGTIYNLSGQRVSRMQRGLYIVNGKKVMNP